MKSTRLIFLAAALLAAALAARAANYEFRPITIANGGGTSAGGSYTFTHSIGQPTLGAARGGTYSVALGHWNQVGATPALPLPDLTVSSSLSPIVVTENIVRPVTLAVTNHGAGDATDVRFIITLPAGLPVTAVTNSAGACTITSSNVTCTVASLLSGGAFTVQLSLRATPLPESSGEFVNLADLSAVVSANEPDLVSADNTLVLPVTVYVRLDWGDARGGFLVTRTQNGARHRFWPGYRLGVLWDSEGQGVHSPNADWDDGQQVDDEDGVTFPNSIIAGSTATVVVNCSFAGFLDTWADFNNDGDWDDPGEHIFASQSLVMGDNTLTFSVPPAVVASNITTRWRASTTGGLSYTGYGDKGEIEDHLAQVQAPTNPTPISFNGQEHLGFGQVSVTTESNALVVSNFSSNTPGGLAIGLPLPAQKITLQLDPVSLSAPGVAITFQVFEPARKGGGNDFDAPQLLSRFSLVNRSNVLEMTSSFWDYDWWWCFTEIPAQVFQSSLMAPLRVEAQARLTEVTAEADGHLKLTFAEPVNVMLPDNASYRVRHVWIAPVTANAQSRPVGQVVLSGQQLPSVRILSETTEAFRPRISIERRSDGKLVLQKNWPYQNRMVLRQAPAITGPWTEITSHVLVPSGPMGYQAGEILPATGFFHVFQPNRVGINFVALSDNPASLDTWDEVLPDLEALNARVLRQVGDYDVMWLGVWDDVAEENNWEQLLELKSKIQASGQDLRFIPTLFQVNKDRAFNSNFPAAPDGTKLSNSANESSVKDYVKEAAGNLYDLTSYFEVMNEASAYEPSFTAAEYATVLNWCREALDDVEDDYDTELKILVGGLLGTDAAQIKNQSMPWLQEVASALGPRATECIDVISFHYYDDWTLLRDVIVTDIKGAMPGSLTDKPLWLTETGFRPGSTYASIEAAAEAQTQDMFRKFSIAFGNGVELVNWHPLVSTCDPTTAGCTSYSGYGLHDDSTAGTATMAWNAYQLFTSKLGNFTTCTPVREGTGNIWAYRYAAPVFPAWTGLDFYRNYWVIWATTSTTTTLADIESAVGATDTVTVTSVTSGFASTTQAVGTVAFGTTPILVEDSRWHSSP